MITIPVKLKSQYAYLDFSKVNGKVVDRICKYWSFWAPGHHFAPKYKAGYWDGKIRMCTRNGVIRAGLFRATYIDAENVTKVHFNVQNSNKSKNIIDLSKGIPTPEEEYKYQQNCVEAMIQAIPNGGGIVLAATGTGKTAITAKFFSNLICPCLFIVDTLALLYQTRDELESWLKEKIGVIGNSEFTPQRITVATRQTLAKHQSNIALTKFLDQQEIVVVDELHEQMSKKNFSIIQTVKPVATYGLTATLELTKKDIRYKAFAFAGPVIFTFSIEKAVESGVVAGGEVLQFLFVPRKKYYTIRGQLYENEVITNEKKLDFIVDVTQYLLNKHNRSVIVLAKRLAHIKNLKEKLIKAGIVPSVIRGSVRKELRDKRVTKFEQGTSNVILASGVFKKGISINRVDAIINVAEERSKNDSSQKYGRGLRLYKDQSKEKKLAYIDIGTGRVAPGMDWAKNLVQASNSRAIAFRRLGIKVKRYRMDREPKVNKLIDGIIK